MNKHKAVQVAAVVAVAVFAWWLLTRGGNAAVTPGSSGNVPTLGGFGPSVPIVSPDYTPRYDPIVNGLLGGNDNNGATGGCCLMGSEMIQPYTAMPPITYETSPGITADYLVTPPVQSVPYVNLPVKPADTIINFATSTINNVSNYAGDIVNNIVAMVKPAPKTVLKYNWS